MPAMLILAAGAMGLVLVVPAVVAVGIRQEPSAQELTRQAPSVMARSARRLLGVYVRRPDPCVIPEKERGEPSPTALGPARQPDRHAPRRRTDGSAALHDVPIQDSHLGLREQVAATHSMRPDARGARRPSRVSSYPGPLSSLLMVRRRSTVRFRNGARVQRSNSNISNRPWGPFRGPR
jgi:hypothetical protein